MKAGLDSDEAKRILWHSMLGLETLELHQLFGHRATIISGAAKKGENTYLCRVSGFGEVNSVDSVNSVEWWTCDSSRATGAKQVRHAKPGGLSFGLDPIRHLISELRHPPNTEQISTTYGKPSTAYNHRHMVARQVQSRTKWRAGLRQTPPSMSRSRGRHPPAWRISL